MDAVRSVPARVLVSPADDRHRFLPEGPREVAVGGRDLLAWVNIQTAAAAAAGEVHFWDWDRAEHTVVRVPGRPGFLLPTDVPDALLLGMGKQVGLFHVPSRRWEPLAEIPDPNPRTAINDAEVAPGGAAVVFGTKDVRFADPLAGLYLFTAADRRVSVLAGGQTCSNGKVFAAAGGGLVLFDIDTPRKVVGRYRLGVDPPTLTEDGVAVDLRGVGAFPDGMCDCGDGTAIVAFYNPDPVPAGRAGRYRLDTGEPVEEWTTPGSPRVTCPLLVGRAGRVQLVLTTAVEGMPADQRGRCLAAGSLFIADTDLPTAPPAEVVRLGG